MSKDNNIVGWLFLIGIIVLVIWGFSSGNKSKSRSASESGCNENYSGCLLLYRGDYDCRGGSGDGPNYTGRVRVIGYDEYGLDRDGDGIGCE